MVMTRAEATALITPEVLRVLKSIGNQKAAFVPEALMDAGVPPALVNVMLADDDRAVPEKARTTVVGKKKRILTKRYVWGPDVSNFLLGIK